MFLRRVLLALVLLGCLGAWLWLRQMERSHEGSTPEPYTLVEEGLYVGGSVAEPPPGTQAVLNLTDAKDRYQAETCLCEPILDLPRAASIEWLRRMVEFIDTQRNAGATTFVHCAVGVSRSGLVVTAYLMYKRGWTRDKALSFLRSKRPQIKPNSGFMELLSEWEQSLKPKDKS